MEKNTLLSFINRYHLAGSVEAVMITETPTGAECEFMDVDQTVVGSLMWKAPAFFDGEIAVNHTSILIKMLSAIGNDLNIDIKYGPDKVAAAMEINEGTTKVTFMLANKAVIPNAPKFNGEPEFNVDIDLTPEFVDKFIKAKNALPDVNNFAVQMKQGVIKIIVNYSTIQSDHIALDIGPTTNDMDPICFSADKLKEILIANKGDTGTMRVSTEGLAKVTFSGDSFDSTYFLIQLQN